MAVLQVIKNYSSPRWFSNFSTHFNLLLKKKAKPQSIKVVVFVYLVLIEQYYTFLCSNNFENTSYLHYPLSVWCFTNMAKYGFIAFIASIGFGFLVVKTPDAVKDFWASTGVTKSAGMGGCKLIPETTFKRGYNE